MKHLVRAQMPFSFEQLKRLDRSIESVDVLVKGKFDELDKRLNLVMSFKVCLVLEK